MTRQRHRFTPTERRHIALRDLYLCRYCGWPVWPWQDNNIAHEISVKNGGSSDFNNLAYSHRKCNQEAGAKNMPIRKRLSTTTIIILAAVIALAAVLAVASIAIASAADAASPQPDEPTWSTSIAVRRAAIKVSSKIGQTKAAHARCGPAVYHFGKALKSWNLKTVRKQNQLGWKALRQCRK